MHDILNECTVLNLFYIIGVCEGQDDADALFLLETIFQIGEQIETIIKYRSLNNQYKIERFFIGMYMYL